MSDKSTVITVENAIDAAKWQIAGITSCLADLLDTASQNSGGLIFLSFRDYPSTQPPARFFFAASPADIITIVGWLAGYVNLGTGRVQRGYWFAPYPPGPNETASWQKVPRVDVEGIMRARALGQSKPRNKGYFVSRDGGTISPISSRTNP